VSVRAPASALFALVADPRRHAELDGSGTVRNGAVSGPDRLSMGAKFTVGMKMYGVPYAITSTVTGFEPDRMIEWRHPFGHRWRWELAGTEHGVTEVTETFDYSTSVAPTLLELFRWPAVNSSGITKTLQALAVRFE
jgi:hypothetical protein